MGFSERLRDLRKEKKMTQEELAKLTNQVNKQLEARWETPIYMKIEDNFYAEYT